MRKVFVRQYTFLIYNTHIQPTHTHDHIHSHTHSIEGKKNAKQQEIEHLIGMVRKMRTQNRLWS